MSNETRLTVIGRLTADPELRFTPSGAAVANLTIATNARTFDKASNEWRDEPATFWRASAWRDMAEHIAESLTKGTAVIAAGVVKSREWQTKDGEKRTSLELDLEAIGPDLRWATARAVKAERKPSGFGQAPQADPWTSQPAQAGWGQQPATDEPPF